MISQSNVKFVMYVTTHTAASEILHILESCTEALSKYSNRAFILLKSYKPVDTTSQGGG